MRLKNKITQAEKDELIEELVKVGAVRREKPLTPGDSNYSSSLGKKGLKTLELKI